MSAVKYLFAASAFALASTLPAHAADYSVDGVFVLEMPGDSATKESPANLQLRCALVPTVNHKDGTFATYFLDREKFLKDGTVSYIRNNDGACSMDAAASLESCKSTSYLNTSRAPEADTYNFYNTLSPQRLDGVSFPSVDDFKAWDAGGRKPDKGAWAQDICDGITMEMVTKHEIPGTNPLSPEESGKQMFYTADPKQEDYDLAAKVMAALKK
ncbi:hypothetical protein [Aestuariivirga litoralis]|uniref:hypothetical protein n=1 Tax=Aestuariivirga litoralis TaxID=2650924 RepID=UPI0018C7CCD0|nr:hypothetical protein [Aestuariivirga litoralis]MBG1233161.1 hypothetical protein [Aestuariivirga litoralis]